MSSLRLPTEADVVVIGAGLAGLACAARTTAAGLSVAVVERSDRVGGRVRTDVVDGFRCDRGFQLLNPAYPQARRVLDLPALRLQPLPSGVVVATAGRRRLLADPRRVGLAALPAALDGALFAGGSLREKARFARWALSCATRDPADLLSAPDEPWGSALDRLGITAALRTGVLDPFLAGVVAEIDGSTSRRFVELLVRSFVRGRPSVPWDGMQAIPDQLAAGLPAGTVHCQVAVTQIGPPSATGSTRMIQTEHGSITARAVVVATDPISAAAFIGCPAPVVRPLTTFWHTAPHPPSRSGALHLDGDRRGPVINTVVMTNAAPGYSPHARPLIASTILGLPAAGAHEPTSEAGVRRHLHLIYGVDTAPWEVVTVHAVEHALTAMPPPLDVRRPVDLGQGLFVVGDHRDSASQQGALVSGRRGGDAVLHALGVPLPPHPDRARR